LAQPFSWWGLESRASYLPHTGNRLCFPESGHGFAKVYSSYKSYSRWSL